MKTNLSSDTPYLRPGWITRHVFNRVVATATRSGMSVWGSRMLEVPGRRSGTPRQTPVNVLTYEGQSYLVAARGQTEWVRNLRANDGRLMLIKGRRRQGWEATEIRDAAKAPILRAYLKRWKMEVGAFFDGVGADTPDAEMARIAGEHPVFSLRLVAP